MTDIRALVEASSLGTPAARESARIVVEPTDHRIAFDHGPCLHHADAELHDCSPQLAEIACEADDITVGCRFGCDGCEVYEECGYRDCDHDNPDRQLRQRASDAPPR